MSQQTIYLDVEEEIPELIERLRHVTADEIPVVVPARSRLGQSRFNFRLLRDYARRLGKRISIISGDAAIQQMAADNGFSSFAGLEEYNSEEAGPSRSLAAVAPAAAPPFVSPGRQYEPASIPAAQVAAVPVPPVITRPAPAPPTRLPRMSMGDMDRPASAGLGGGRFLLYLGTALILLVALVGVAVLVPAATVTLTAKAQPLASSASFDAAPGAPPVKIRLLSAKKDASRQFKATGSKTVTPATYSQGSVTFSNTCGVDILMKAGQQLVSGGGVPFIQQAQALVKDGSSVTVAVGASNPGPSSNVGAGQINQITNGSKVGSCLTVTNPAATTGGADEVKQTFVSQGDLDSARSQIEGDLRGQVTDDIGKQVGTGEKLGDTVDFKSDFNSDHRAGDTVGAFTATVSMTGNGASYTADDVKAALIADLRKHIPAGFALTDNAVQTDYHVTQSAADGHLSFSGTSKGFVAPRLDFEKIRGRLLGQSTASARLYLGTLPVEAVDIRQKPLNLPLMPLLGSRIDLKYVVDSGSAPAPTK